MVDASWDNSGMPAPKRGMSVWAKIGLGCGVAFLLLGLLCGGCIFFGFQKASSSFDASWGQMRSVVQSLETDDGARQLYTANERLKENFPTEEEFLKAAAEWRPKLDQIPQQRPDLKTLFAEQKMEYNVRNLNGHQAISIRYRMNSGSRLFLDWDEKQLVDIRVE